MQNASLVLFQGRLSGILGLHDVIPALVVLLITLLLQAIFGRPALVVGRAALDESLECAEATDVGELGIVACNRLHQGS